MLVATCNIFTSVILCLNRVPNARNNNYQPQTSSTSYVRIQRTYTSLFARWSEEVPAVYEYIYIIDYTRSNTWISEVMRIVRTRRNSCLVVVVSIVWLDRAVIDVCDCDGVDWLSCKYVYVHLHMATFSRAQSNHRYTFFSCLTGKVLVLRSSLSEAI